MGIDARPVRTGRGREVRPFCTGRGRDARPFRIGRGAEGAGASLARAVCLVDHSELDAREARGDGREGL